MAGTSTELWGVSRVDRGIDGIPDRLGRIGGCGNAVVPQCSEVIGRIVMAIANGEEP